jgi:hypothetical protein
MQTYNSGFKETIGRYIEQKEILKKIKKGQL